MKSKSVWEVLVYDRIQAEITYFIVNVFYLMKNLFFNMDNSPVKILVLHLKNIKSVNMFF